MDTEKKQTTLPSLSDLHHDMDIAFQNDKLNLLLNQTPPKDWLKNHPTATKEIILPNGDKQKVPVQYLPIEKVELMLTRIFQKWEVQVISYQQVFQSIAVHVRLRYTDPLTGEWCSQDGLGAVGVQTDKGASAADLGAIKQDAVMKALPAAESYAVKDAAEKIGKLFGKDINRRDTMAFTSSYTKEAADTPPVEIQIPIEIENAIFFAQSHDQLNAILEENPQLHSSTKLRDLVVRRREILNAAKTI